MSSKARRIADAGRAEPFAWAPIDELAHTPPGTAPAPVKAATRRPAAAPPDPAIAVEKTAADTPVEVPAPPPIDTEQTQRRLAELEREAFAKGYASGEQAGLEAGTTRADAMLRRLGDTLTELDGLRQQIVAQTERQMVQIALAVARSILRREVSMDQDLVAALARVAVDRLGDQATATIR